MEPSVPAGRRFSNETRRWNRKTDLRLAWQISVKQPTHERMRRLVPQPKFGAGRVGKNSMFQLSLHPYFFLLFILPNHAMMLSFSAIMAALLVIPGVHGLSFLATAGEITTSIPRNIWFQRLVFIMQTFALPIAIYFRPLCILVEVFW